MNRENITALANHLRNLPEDLGYDQSAFIATPKCGTVACIAGHAVYLLDRERWEDAISLIEDNGLSPHDASDVTLFCRAATSLLGLTTTQSMRLFAGQWEDATTKQAVEILDWLILQEDTVHPPAIEKKWREIYGQN